MFGASLLGPPKRSISAKKGGRYVVYPSCYQRVVFYWDMFGAAVSYKDPNGLSMRKQDGQGTSAHDDHERKDQFSLGPRWIIRNANAETGWNVHIGAIWANQTAG